MINLLKSLPKQVYVACSGGVDSTVLLHKLVSSGKEVTVLHFLHDSSQADEECQFVVNQAKQFNTKIIISKPQKLEIKNNKEAQWRQGRLNFLKSFDGIVGVGTNLDDALEWYMFSCISGEGHYLKYANENVVKPLLLTKKTEIYEYAKTYNLEWREDKTNLDVEFASRNRIRNNIIPQILQINPGIYSVIKKRIFEKEFTFN